MPKPHSPQVPEHLLEPRRKCLNRAGHLAIDCTNGRREVYRRRRLGYRADSAGKNLCRMSIDRRPSTTDRDHRP